MPYIMAESYNVYSEWRKTLAEHYFSIFSTDNSWKQEKCRKVTKLLIWNCKVPDVTLLTAAAAAALQEAVTIIVSTYKRYERTHNKNALNRGRTDRFSNVFL